jgi:hypothetical protein
MALLYAGIDRDRIRMIGRWRSDEMLPYLHLQAQPLMTGVSAAMPHLVPSSPRPVCLWPVGATETLRGAPQLRRGDGTISSKSTVTRQPHRLLHNCLEDLADGAPMRRGDHGVPPWIRKRHVLTYWLCNPSSVIYSCTMKILRKELVEMTTFLEQQNTLILKLTYHI